MNLFSTRYLTMQQFWTTFVQPFLPLFNSFQDFNNVFYFKFSTQIRVKYCAFTFTRLYVYRIALIIVGMDIKENRRGLLKLKSECERVVKALSMTQQAEPYVEAMMEGVDFKTRITRMRFEDLCYDLFEKSKVISFLLTLTKFYCCLRFIWKVIN